MPDKKNIKQVDYKVLLEEESSDVAVKSDDTKEADYKSLLKEEKPVADPAPEVKPVSGVQSEIQLPNIKDRSISPLPKQEKIPPLVSLEEQEAALQQPSSTIQKPVSDEERMFLENKLAAENEAAEIRKNAIEMNFSGISERTGVPVDQIKNAAEILRIAPVSTDGLTFYEPGQDVLPEKKGEAHYSSAFARGLYTGVGETFNMVAGAHRMVQDFLGLPPTVNPFKDVADIYLADRDKWTEAPDDALGDLLFSAGAILPDIAMSHYALPNMASAQLAKLTGGVVKSLPSFATYLGLKEGFGTFEETGDYVESTKEGLEGFKTGLYYQALGMTGTEVGNLVSKMSTNELLGAGADATAASLLFAGSGMAESGDWSWRTFASGFGIGVGFGIPKINSAVKRVATKKLMGSYFTSTPALEAEAREVTKTNLELRKEAVDLRIQAQKAEGVEKDQLLLRAAKLENIIGIRATTEMIKESPEELIEAIKNDKSLSQNEADYFIKKVQDTFLETNEEINKLKPQFKEIEQLNKKNAAIDEMDVSPAEKEVLKAKSNKRLGELAEEIKTIIKIEKDAREKAGEQRAETGTDIERILESDTEGNVIPINRERTEPGGSGQAINPVRIKHEHVEGVEIVGEERVLKIKPEGAESFHEAIGRAQKENPKGVAVEQKSVEDYRKSQLFLTDDGGAGLAITEKGDIVSVFKNPNISNSKQTVGEMMFNAVEKGGKTLDAFDINGFLPNYYAKFGFEPVAKVKFDKKIVEADLAEKGLKWDKSMGEPDIVFMVHNGEPVSKIKISTYEKYDPAKLEYSTYDNALKARDSALKEKYTEPKTGEVGYTPLDQQNEVISSFTHYNSGGKSYPRTIWANWFLSKDRPSKERIAKEIRNNPKLKNALVSSWYDEYKKETGEDISFEDFLNKDIEVYRGRTNSDIKKGEPAGFKSFTPTEQEAKNFSETGKIDKIKVKPKDTFGLIQSVGAEREILIPTEHSKEFYKSEWDQLSSDKVEMFEKMNKKDLETLGDFETAGKYKEAIDFLSNKITESNATKKGETAKAVGQEREKEAKRPEAPETGKQESLEAGEEKAIEVSEERAPIIVKSGANVFGIELDNNAAIALWKKYFTAQGHLPGEVFRSWVRSQGNVRKQLLESHHKITDFKKAMRRAYGKKIIGVGDTELYTEPKVTKEQLGQINEALTVLGVEGKQREALVNIPEVLHEPLINIRNHIDALSREMVRSGLVEGDLAATIQENLGFYMTRTYRAHNDKSWTIENIPEEVKNRAISFVKGEFPDLSQERVEGILEKLLLKDGLLGSFSKGKMGAKDLGIFKHRKDIPVEIREFLGEYKDPAYNYATSVSKMAELIERHKFLEQMKKDGKGKFLFAEPTKGFSTPIVVEGDYRFHPLSWVSKFKGKDGEMVESRKSYHTSPEIAKVFQTFDKSSPMSNLTKAYVKYLNVPTKYGKTILSPVTHARNYYANYLFHVANGRFIDGFGGKMGKAMGKAHKTVFQDMAGSSNVEFRNYLKRLVELNVVGESTRAGEVHDIVRDAEFLQDFDRYGDNLFKKAGKKTLKGLEKLYQVEDDVHKIVAFETEKARYEPIIKKRNPKASPEEITRMSEEKAADIVRATMPTYSLVPKIIKELRRVPLVGTFVSFPAEVIRTTGNTLALAAREMKGSDTRAIGVKRMAGILTAASITGIASTISRNLAGVDKQDERDMRRFVAPWSKNSDLMVLENKGSGVYTYVDVGFSDPYNYLKKPITALLKGDDIGDASWEGIVQLVEPFLGEELLASRLTDIVRNKKKDSGAEVYEPAAELGDRMKAQFKYLWEGVQPGAIYTGKRISKSFKKDVNDYGMGLTPKNELMNLFLGVRSNDLVVARSMGFKLRRGSANLDSAFDIYDKTRYDEKMSDKDRKTELGKAEHAAWKVLSELHQDYAAAIRLGVPKEELDVMVRDSRIGSNSKVRRAIVSGEFPGIDPDTGKLKSSGSSDRF